MRFVIAKEVLMREECVVFVIERERVLMTRREGLYSGQERCLRAKREWRSMNNAGRRALRATSN